MGREKKKWIRERRQSGQPKKFPAREGRKKIKGSEKEVRADGHKTSKKSKK